MPALHIHPEVEQSLRDAQPVVALESAVTTAGLPRKPHEAPKIDNFAVKTALVPWKNDSPVNLELARAMQRVVAHGGAMPATIAVQKGILRIGLTDPQLEQLALDTNAGKCSAGDMAVCIARGASAGTTVSATLTAINSILRTENSELRTSSNPSGDSSAALRHPRLQPIRVFATGGIGGVHRNWNTRPDISHDLIALSRTPVCVVCSGGKSLLDLPATLETLETLGVPIVGYETKHFPRFTSGIDESLPLRHTTNDINTIADICRTHWIDLKQSSAVLVVQPVPDSFALDERMERDAMAQAVEQKIVGPARTPFILEHVNQLTGGASLRSNIALLLSNAALAAKLAVKLRNI